MMPTAGELAAGMVVADRYRLDRRIGQGGMGSVWAASHVVTRRAVALKFLRRSEESDESRRRFVREARAASAVAHPSVVEVLDFLELSDGSPVMVLELLEGESLAALLAREGKLSVARTAEILAPVVSAVGSAHAQGIVHRDLKPDNIFLQKTRDGALVVKVLDFGIAKVTVVDAETRRDAGLTHTGAVLGTPAYMSPEQVFAETDLDHRADVWALGIILYRCLSGVLPTDAANVGQVYKIIVAGKIKPLRDLVPDVPEELAQLVDRMLERERTRRPGDLRPVLETLLRFTDKTAPSFGAPCGATSLEDSESLQIPEDTDGPETLALTGDASARPVLAASSGGRRWLLPAGAVVVVGLIVGATAAFNRPARPEPRAAASAEAPVVAPSSSVAAITEPRGSAVGAVVTPPATSASLPTLASARRPRAPTPAARPTPSATAKPVTHPEDPYGF